MNLTEFLDHVGTHGWPGGDDPLLRLPAAGEQVVQQCGQQDRLLHGVIALHRSLILADAKLQLSRQVPLPSNFTVWYGIHDRYASVAVKKPQRHGFKCIATTAETLAKDLLMWKEVKHDNIVNFYGASMVGGTFSLVLEWMPGGTLASYVQQRRRSGKFDEEFWSMLTHAEARPLMLEESFLMDISNGMLYLHSQLPQILHLSLTPNNVLLDDRILPCAKLSDIGLGKLRHCDRHDFDVQLPMQAYLAPEIRYAQKWAAAADVFAFGALSVFIVIGKTLEFVPKPATCHHCLHGHVRAVFPNQILHLAAKCLVENPQSRIDFKTVCETLSTAEFAAAREKLVRGAEHREIRKANGDSSKAELGPPPLLVSL
eukprot:TRINITY_DN27848_c0_g1_i1.p1 TRINITY_DN27848_c0_g1~~TRINITY_DN27848_c0_g1_i1.p1  ORF type:complete len:371 (-),score=60.74 TRINITY_DN27848_c0_g1_i1:254-1366(-)